jgi:PHYB activation tagged suppressor 1
MKFWSSLIDFRYNTGKNYLQWHGSQAQLVITEPELCREILNDKDGAYVKMEPTPFIKKLFGEGLGTRTKSDEKWAQLRKISNHAFLGESLKVSRFIL